MQKILFLSAGQSANGASFSDTARSVLEQRSGNWKWIIEEQTFNQLNDDLLIKKLKAHASVVVLNSKSPMGNLNMSDSSAVCFLHPGFSLVPHFINEIDNHSASDDFDLLYTDLQLLNDDGDQEQIWRRPHSCLERLLHHNYLSGALVVKKHVFERVFAGGESELSEVELMAICDVMVTGGVIRHVFEPLVKNKRHNIVKLMSKSSPQWLHETTKMISSKGLGFVHAPGPTGKTTIRRLPKEKVSVSIVIPTRGDKKRIWGIETDLIENVVQSLFQKTTNDEFEVIVVHDNNAAYEEHAQSLAQYGNRIKMVCYDKPFNFADKCNVGALSSSAHVLVFLNDDIEVIDPWWLDHLVGYLESSEVGAVGPVLLLDNGMVQSAGHVNQPLPANYHSGKPFGVKSFPEPLDIPCEVSGLTAACVAVRREVFDEVGGFCEDLPNNFNDVDFCLKIQETGRSLIWTPLARLYHFETTTRVTTVTEEETQFIKDRWGRTFGVDLYRSRID
jgi:O-antigen biosynthesis protein